MPSFDHGVGDPVEDDIQVQAHHKYVLVEGNYLLLGALHLLDPLSIPLPDLGREP